MRETTQLLQDPNERRKVQGLRTRPGRRRSSNSRTVNAGLKLSAREARALRVVARELGLGHRSPGTLLLRVYSLTEVLRFYDQMRAERRAQDVKTPASAGTPTGA